MTRVLVLLVVLAAALTGSAGAAGFTLPGQVTGPVGADAFSRGFEFRPFGWSAAGAFAYLESRFVDGRGGTVFRYVIMDTVEDKVVFEYRDDSFDWPDGGQDATAEQAWAKDAETVSAALQSRRIVQAPDALIRRFPFTRSGDRYTAELKVETDPQKDETEDGRVSAYSLTLNSQKRGSKTVTRSEGSGAMNVQLDGYIASPFEPRVLVVVSVQKRGFEGSDEYLRFYGAHLTAGFRK